jgi:hypothetical protein
MDRDDYDYEDDMPAGHVMCPRCDGHRTVDCHCGGDLCVCENYGEMDCPMCLGEGDVKKERADRYHARQAEYAKVLREALEQK